MGGPMLEAEQDEGWSGREDEKKSAPLLFPGSKDGALIVLILQELIIYNCSETPRRIKVDKKARRPMERGYKLLRYSLPPLILLLALALALTPLKRT